MKDLPVASPALSPGESSLLSRGEEVLRRALERPVSRTLLFLGLLLGVALVLALRLGSAEIGRSSEERCFAVARTMNATGDWLVPYLEGSPRLQKPPLFYWLAAAVGRWQGELTLGGLRSVSVAAALALVVLVFVWGHALGGASVAFLAVAFLLGTLQFWTLGRRGDAEMLLCLATTASLFCFDRLATTGSRRLLWWFAVLLALAFLAKATMALLLIGVPVLVFLVVQRRLAQAFRWRVLACLGLALLASVTWYLVILAVVPGAWEMLKGEILLTLGDQEATQKSVAHYREIHYYVPQLLAKMALTALFLPLVVVRGRRTRWWRERPSERFLFVTVVSLFLALSLLPQKQRHYLMPLHPPAALLIACSVVPLAREGLAASRRWWRTLGAGSVALGLLLAGAGGLFLGWLLAEPLAVWSAAVAGTLALTVLAYRLAAARAPRLLTTCLLALLLGGAGLHYGGFDVLASKFEAGVTSPAELDVAYWRQFFDAHPLARRVLKAEEWPPRPEPSRTQPRKKGAPEASAPSSTAKRP